MEMRCKQPSVQVLKRTEQLLLPGILRGEPRLPAWLPPFSCAVAFPVLSVTTPGPQRDPRSLLKHSPRRRGSHARLYISRMKSSRIDCKTTPNLARKRARRRATRGEHHEMLYSDLERPLCDEPSSFLRPHLGRPPTRGPTQAPSAGCNGCTELPCSALVGSPSSRFVDRGSASVRPSQHETSSSDSSVYSRRIAVSMAILRALRDSNEMMQKQCDMWWCSLGRAC